MKKVLLSTLFVLLFAGMASATVSAPVATTDFYSDLSQLYGLWTGTITIGDQTYDYSLTIGRDSTAHLPGDFDNGYFYLPESFDTSTNPNTYAFSDGPLLDEYDSPYSYQTTINNGLFVDTITYFEAALDYSWSTLLTLIFNPDLDELRLTGFTYDNDEGANTIAAHLTRATPIPGAVWLLATGLIGLIGLRRRDQA